MIEDFYTDKCDIYHIKSTEADMDFGLPSSTDFSYSEVPDISNQPCKFHVTNKSVKLEQGAPDNKLFIQRKLSCSVDVDIRVNDRVVDCETGLEYKALQPDNVRNHHKTVILIRMQEQAIL